MSQHLAELWKVFLKRSYRETAIDFRFSRLIDHEERNQTKNNKESTQHLDSCN